MIAPDQYEQLLLMGALVLFSAFFSGSETALFYLQRDELRNFRRGRASQRMAAALLDQPGRLLSAVLFWNLVVNLAYFAIASGVTLELEKRFGATRAGLFGLASLAALVLCGEVAPKSIAVTMRRPLARLVSFPLAFTVRLVDIILPSLELITLLSQRAFWPHFRSEAYLTPDDLERAVEFSSDQRELSRPERVVVDNVLDLSEIRADEWMRPRGKFRWFRPPVHLKDLRGEPPPSGYVLIAEEDSEEVCAAVQLRALSEVPERHLEHYAEQVVYVPWSASTAQVLDEMRTRLLNVAVVVNEYGETQGVLTYEDILDGIFREDYSRTGRLLGRQPIRRIGADRYHVEGMTSLRVLASYFRARYKVGRSVTIIGYLQEQLGRVPETGDTGHWQEFRIRVVDKAEPAYFLLELTKQTVAK